jgi:hypothetical protein
MNDALCEMTWAGPKKQNIGMGYICEGDFESAGNERAIEVDESAEFISLQIVLPKVRFL